MCAALPNPAPLWMEKNLTNNVPTIQVEDFLIKFVKKCSQKIGLKVVSDVRTTGKVRNGWGLGGGAKEELKSSGHVVCLGYILIYLKKCNLNHSSGTFTF